MKVKDLIKELKECDQDAVVCVEGQAIWYVDQLPGYYDGCYDEVVEDDDGSETLIVRDDGTKVVIKILELDRFLLNDPDMAVEVRCRSTRNQERWERRIEEMREENRKILESAGEKSERTSIPQPAGWMNKLVGIFKRNTGP